MALPNKARQTDARANSSNNNTNDAEAEHEMQKSEQADFAASMLGNALNLSTDSGNRTDSHFEEEEEDEDIVIREPVSFYSASDDLIITPKILFVQLIDLPEAVMTRYQSVFLTGKFGNLCLHRKDCVIGICCPNVHPKPRSLTKDKYAYYHLGRQLKSPLYSTRIYRCNSCQFDTLHSY